MQRPPDLDYFLSLLETVHRMRESNVHITDVVEQKPFDALDLNIKMIMYQHMNLRKDEWGYFLKDDELRIMSDTFKPFSHTAQYFPLKCRF